MAKNPIDFVPTHEILLSQIDFDKNNPNVLQKSKQEGLDKIVKKHGFAVDPWLNKLKNGRYLVIDGEWRIKLLLKKGIKKAKCKIFQVPYPQVRILRQVANKLHGIHDKKLDALELKAIFEDRNLSEFAKFLGEPVEDFQQILEKNFDIKFEPQETDEIPEPPKKPKSKLGDIYQLGNHRVMCGDSTKDLDRLMIKNAKITVTSPPYNMGINARATDKDVTSKYKNSDDNMENYLEFLCLFTKSCMKYSKYTFVDIQQLAGNKLDFIDYLYTFKHNFCDRIIWDKEQAAPALAKNITNSQFEDILIFRTKINPSRSINTGKQFHGTISNIYRGRPQKNNDIADIHKATFPLHLPSFIIKNFSVKNDIIIDPFLGSGTTLIACEQTKRICYGMELDPAYVDVIVKRFINYLGTDKDVYVIRNGKKIPYSKINKK